MELNHLERTTETRPQVAARRLRELSGGGSRALAIGAPLLVAGGVVAWGVGAGYLAFWLFSAAAVVVALALPFPAALVSPLFMSLLGWLVDMQPFVLLAGWAAVVVRWLLMLFKERRLPRGGWWIWLPIGLAGWTVFGVITVPATEFRHFLLIFGVQVLTSGTLLAVVDQLGGPASRARVVAGVVTLVVVMSIGVVLQFIGVPVQGLQDEEVSTRVEAAYGLDAFPNNLEMIKYGLSKKAGARGFRARMERFAQRTPGLPAFEVFLPRFRAYENSLVVRFTGSARAYEDELRTVDVGLLYDNVGLTPANTVPRMRSFARNSLTYAGLCVVLFPLCFFLAWKGEGYRRWLGWAGIAACLFGSGFSLVRGSWIAILIGIVYLLVDGLISWRHKTQVVIAYLVGALVLTGFFLARYEIDPLNARALGKGSVTTRASLYEDTVEALGGIRFLVGFGTEQPRTDEGTSHVANRYVPDAGTHSTYLNFLFRAGVPAALAIIAIYVIAWWRARTSSRRSEGRERMFGALLAASVVSAAAHGVILNLFTEPLYTLTVALVLGMATAAVARTPASE
jgi:O-Antigen ligase